MAKRFQINKKIKSSPNIMDFANTALSKFSDRNYIHKKLNFLLYLTMICTDKKRISLS